MLDLWAPLGPSQAVGHDKQFDSLFLFWQTCIFTHAPEGQLGVSWIELFARFQAVGGIIEEKVTDGRFTFKKMLIRFVQASRALFGSQGSSSVLELFKPSRHIGLRLSGYGIHSRIPCTQVLLCLSTAHAALMHAQLLTLKPLGKKNKTNSGRTTVSFKFPANPPWAHLCNSTVLPELIEARAEGGMYTQAYFIRTRMP